MNRFYSASDSNIDVLKQDNSSKNNENVTLRLTRVINNWKIIHSYTEKMHPNQPEDLKRILEKFYAELRKI